MRFCNRCMEKLKDETVCPYCGTELNKLQETPHALRPGTVLNGKYLIGNVLGQGGFGITYIGFDLALEVKVAIKEYFISGSASRADSKTQEVYWLADPENMNHFITEARRMAMLEHMSEIAHVRDVFYENNTAYIIMEYVEGEELKRFLQNNGTISYEKAVRLMLPVIEALGRVHEKGIVHRDISPDNLMMEPGGTLRVLDLGAAGDLSRNNGQASQMVARHGFSPYEQYIEAGKIGPWTDVYAVCATIYYCCVGKVIPDAYTRVDQYLKTQVSNITMDPVIPVAGSEILQKGLALEVTNRIANMQQLAEELRDSLDTNPTVFSVRKKKQNGRPSGKRAGSRNGWIVAATLFAAVGISIIILSRLMPEPAVSESLVEVKQETVAPVQAQESRRIALEICNTMDMQDVALGYKEMVPVLSGPETSKIHWTSSNPQVVSVSEIGELTVTGMGSSNITAEYEDQTVVCKVNVTLKGNVICTYEKNNNGLSITGYEGDLPAHMIIPHTIDGVSVTKIGKDAFRGCTGLISVVIPDSVTRIGQYAFSDCLDMASILIPNSVRTIEGYAFYGCSALPAITIPGSVTSLGESAFAYCTNLISVTIPRGITVIERSLFSGCKKLKEVNFAENVSVIQEGAFWNCTSLMEVTIPAKVTEIGSRAFSSCFSLEKVTFSDNITVIGEAAFSGCSGITELSLPKKLANIRKNAFMGCTALTSVTFPDKKIHIETEAFHECSNLARVTISNDCELGYGAFPLLCTINFY